MTEPIALHRVLPAGLRKRKDQLAIIFEGQAFSYEKLERQVRALAASFNAADLPGERVGLMLPNSIELVCCYLACFCIGAIAVPVSPLYTSPELMQVLGVAEPKWLIIDAARRKLLDGLDRGAFGIERIVLAGGAEDQLAALLIGDAAYPSGDPPPSQPALIFFTSGSTGKPKGVLHTQGSALAILTSTCEALGGVDAADRILVCEPQVHPSGFIATFSVLLRGGTAGLLAQLTKPATSPLCARWHQASS